MFSNKITQSDPFLSMPASSQNLYFHLNLDADDDGFVNRPKAIMRTINANEDDMNLLIARKFIIPFKVEDNNALISMIIVIKHWWIHNYIRPDRKKDTTYVKELNMLSINENKAYSLQETPLNSELIPLEGQVTDKRPHRLDKISLEEIRLDKTSVVETNQEKEEIPFQKIISYLNKEANTKFKNVEGHKKFIRARWNEGYDLEDFKKVIDNKVKEWKGATWLFNGKKMIGDSLLRPSTLFSNKFDTYLNQVSSVEQEQQVNKTEYSAGESEKLQAQWKELADKYGGEND